MQTIGAHLERLLGEEMQLATGAAYLVPKNWWEETCFFNFEAQTLQELVFPCLNLTNRIDPFLLDFEDGILSELEHKSNYLKFDRITLSPDIKEDVEWMLISPALWTRIRNYLTPKFSLLTYFEAQNPSILFTQPRVQVQLVFCAKNKSEAFVGFISAACTVIEAVRSIGYELGFIEMQNSRILFPEHIDQQPMYFCELENKTLADLPDTLLMAFNMETADKKTAQFSFNGKNPLGDSNEAVNGEQEALENTWDLLRNDGTMSTGAETPSFVFSEAENGQFRVRELFREKKPEEIAQMKAQAEKSIDGPLIPIRCLSLEELELELEALALEIVESSHAHKKKHHKEKQLQ